MFLKYNSLFFGDQAVKSNPAPKIRVCLKHHCGSRMRVLMRESTFRDKEHVTLPGRHHWLVASIRTFIYLCVMLSKVCSGFLGGSTLEFNTTVSVPPATRTLGEATVFLLNANTVTTSKGQPMS
jgi:hypothetical protein